MQLVVRFFRINIAVMLLLGGIFAAMPGLAAGSGESSSPIHIEADRMVSKEDKNSVVFMGNVDARQDDVVIRSDEMTVYYEPEKGKTDTSSSKVKKLICIGNVEITRGDWLGTGKRMDYMAGDRKVILSGDAKAWQGQNMVQGKTIVYYLDEGRSIVEQDKAAKGRVKAVIHPDKKK